SEPPPAASRVDPRPTLRPRASASRASAIPLRPGTWAPAVVHRFSRNVVLLPPRGPVRWPRFGLPLFYLLLGRRRQLRQHAAAESARRRGSASSGIGVAWWPRRPPAQHRSRDGSGILHHRRDAGPIALRWRPIPGVVTSAGRRHCGAPI